MIRIQICACNCHGNLVEYVITEYIIDRRTPMLAAGLRELLILDEDYVSMVAWKDIIDHAILEAFGEAGYTGKQTGEIASELEIDHEMYLVGSMR